MNEVRALVEAFDSAIAGGVRCALATIVGVEGSSYRRAGARMLITERGATTGTISAGCLENDVVEHARRVIEMAEAKVVEYNNASTTDEMAWGLGLGCNGIVRVLIEPVCVGSQYIEALRDSYATDPTDQAVSVATIYKCEPVSPAAAPVPIGARLFVDGNGSIRRERLNGSAAAIADAVSSTVNGSSVCANCSVEIDGSVAEVFVEKLLPPVPLIIFGAGHDALPIAELAMGLGWHIEVVDPQACDVSRERFAKADRVTLARPGDFADSIAITPRTLALVMSHNYAHDLECLRFLLASPARYLGVMGPRKRTERMLAELTTADPEFRVDEEDLSRIYSPVGLDIGANGPAEIALSIVAEMRTVMEGKRGGPLRESRGPIQNAAQRSEHKERVAAVILAAGASSRMGRPKQTLRIGDTSLLRHAARSAIEAGCSPVIVVTGANAELSRRELAGLDVREVWNSKWETGMGSSVSSGINGVLETAPNTSAAVVMLCDQPCVTADVISRFISAHRLTRNAIVASRYGDGFGVPALFRSSLFGELVQLDGTAGAKAVIARHASEAHFINLPEGEIDVDTPDDYLRIAAKDGIHQHLGAEDGVLTKNVAAQR